MGDVRYVPYYETVRDAPEPIKAIRALEDDAVIAALAAATQEGDPYLANVLATEAQNRMRRARTVAASLGEGVFALDREGRATYLNEATLRLIGRRREELIGHEFHSIVHQGEERACGILRVLQTGRPFAQSDDVFRRSDGTPIPVDYTATPLVRDDVIEGVVVVFRDVSERHRSEAALRESEERLRLVVTKSPVVVLVLDAEGRFMLVEGKALALLGIEPGALVGKSIYDAYADEPEVLSTVRRGLRGESFRADVSMMGIVFDTHVSPVFDAFGACVGMTAVATDVTERRRSERELRTMMRFEHTIAEISSHLVGDAAWYGVMDGILESVRAFDRASRAYLFMFSEDGKTMSNTHERCAPGVAPMRETLQNIPLERYAWWTRALSTGAIRIPDVAKMPPEARSEQEVLARQSIHSLVIFPIEEHGKLRGYIGLDYVVPGATWSQEGESLLAITAGLLGTALARDRATDELRSSEARLDLVLETIAEGIVVTDRDGRIVFANASAERLLGLRREDILVRAYDAPAWLNTTLEGKPLAASELPISIVLRTRKAVRNMTHRAVRPDGAQIALRVNATPIFGQDGTFQGVVASFDDVTRGRLAEEARGRLAAIVEASNDAITGTTLDGVITTWNQGAERLYGYTAAEAVGQHISMLAPTGRRSEIDNTLRKVQAGERIDHVEAERRHKDGTLIPVELSISTVRDERGRITGAAAIAHDIRKRTEAERALRESEARFRTLFQAAGLGMALADPDRRFVEVNEVYSRILGYPREEIIGRRIEEFTHPDDREQDIPKLRALLEGKQPVYQVVKRYVRKDGRVVHARITASVVRDPDGTPRNTIAVIEPLGEARRDVGAGYGTV